jgi:hypothetical protein
VDPSRSARGDDVVGGQAAALRGPGGQVGDAAGMPDRVRRLQVSLG